VKEEQGIELRAQGVRSKEKNSATSHRGVGPPYGPEAVSSVRDKIDLIMNLNRRG
jgi:hypothetical protein